MVLHQYKTPNPIMGQLTTHESKHHCVPRPVYLLPLNVPTPVIQSDTLIEQSRNGATFNTLQH